MIITVTLILCTVHHPYARRENCLYVRNTSFIYREFPGELEKIRVWFRDYKKPDGKPENKFGFDNQYKNREYTLQVIQETHELYNKLKSGKRENTEGLALA